MQTADGCVLLKWMVSACLCRRMIVFCFFFFKQKTAYEMIWWLEFRRVLFRSYLVVVCCSYCTTRHRLIFWILMVSQNIRIEIAMSTPNTTIFVVALFVVWRTFLNECRSLLISVYTQLCSSRYTYINQLVNLARVENNVRIWFCWKVIVIPYWLIGIS